MLLFLTVAEDCGTELEVRLGEPGWASRVKQGAEKP